MQARVSSEIFVASRDLTLTLAGRAYLGNSRSSGHQQPTLAGENACNHARQGGDMEVPVEPRAKEHAH